MSDSLYDYYERELSFFRRQASVFASNHRTMANALLLRESESQDPHVERLIEAFALIAGRIHRRLDDAYPELTEGLLEVLYPHYLAPVPSMAVVELVLDPRCAQIPEGHLIDRQTQLRTQAIHGLPCKYRTCYPVRLWPVEVQSAAIRHAPDFPRDLDLPPGTRSILQIGLGGLGGLSLAKIRLDSLRFFLAGPLGTSLDLYELILNHVITASLIPIDDRKVRDRPAPSPDLRLTPVGFEPEEALLPYSGRSFPGYRLLTELFAFPSKFLFFELGGLRPAFDAAGTRDLEVVLFLDTEAQKLQRIVDQKNLRLHCTPVVNLFERTAEPIRLDHARPEYPIVPDVTHPTGMEVYRVDSVRGIDAATGAVASYDPLYSLSREAGSETFWVASRRESSRPGDAGSEVVLSLVDRALDPKRPSDSTLVVRALCTNRDRPLSLIQSHSGPEFTLDAVAPLMSKVPCLVGPTVSHRPPMGRLTQWQIVSHLSLNYLSLVSEEGGIDALRQLLRLYRMFVPPDQANYPGVRLSPFGGAPEADGIIGGITAVSSRRAAARLRGDLPGAICRGLEVTIDLDATRITASEAFFLGGILERFFGLYTSINSFSALSIRFQGSKGYLKRWPPRAGTRQIL